MLSTILVLLTATMEATKEIFGKLPTFQQKRLTEYRELLQELENARSETPPDNNLIDYRLEKLKIFTEAFANEIKSLANTSTKS